MKEGFYGEAFALVHSACDLLAAGTGGIVSFPAYLADIATLPYFGNCRRFGVFYRKSTI